MKLIISTHAPLAGRDMSYAEWARQKRGFQPTRPLRGATNDRCVATASQNNFNPRAPCGARPSTRAASLPDVRFQPTRPLRGATMSSLILTGRTRRFQPTRPLRGATTDHVTLDNVVIISTHAPLAGRDGLLCDGICTC